MSYPSPRTALRLIAVVLISAVFAAGCVAEVSNIDTSVSVVAPPPRPTDTIEFNDVGDMILPRVIEGSFASDDCDFVDAFVLDNIPVTPECGWLTRPLFRGQGKEIELPVMIFRSTGVTPVADPVIYLHGGPSGGILEYMPYVYESIVEPFVADRDVIVFDQRGTGLAKPGLRCDSPYRWFSAYDEDPETFVPRTAGICAFDLFADNIQLDQFSRQSSADDVMALARELGYESFNLHGSSWGGILAYTVMQLHPDKVRAAILDSPLSIDTDLTGSMPGSFYEAMQAMQANCDRSSSCASRHGDIVARYERVFEALKEKPLRLVLDGIWPVQLTANELSYLLFGLFYSPDAIAMIPDLLVDIENGDVRLAQQLASDYGWGWGIDFTFLTYMCTDIVPASSLAQVEAQQIGIEAFDRVDDAPDGRGHTAEAICERMKVRTPAAPAMREVTPTTPMIVFSGSMDPITSRSSGEAIAAGVPNGTFVGFDDLSHGVTHQPCGIATSVAFLANPEAPLDLMCATDRPAFVFERVGHTNPR